jgi:hypothetical protein
MITTSTSLRTSWLVSRAARGVWGRGGGASRWRSLAVSRGAGRLLSRLGLGERGSQGVTNRRVCRVRGVAIQWRRTCVCMCDGCMAPLTPDSSWSAVRGRAVVRLDRVYM